MASNDTLERLVALTDQEELSDAEIDWTASRLGESDPEVRLIACELLGEELAPADVAALLGPLMADPHPHVRAAAMDAMGCVMQEAEDHDLYELEGRPDWIEERGWVAPEDARDVLARLQSTSRDVEEPLDVRAAALRSLGYVGHLENVDELIEQFVQRPEPLARQAALEAAAASGLGDRWAAAVTEALGDEDAEVRAAAALASGRLRMNASTPYLDKMTLEGEEPEIEAAAIALFILSTPEDRDHLADRLRIRGLGADLIEDARYAAEELEEEEEEDPYEE